MLSRLVIIFLPRSYRLLISWLQSPSAVILEPRKIKSDTASTVSPSICHEVMGLDVTNLVFWMLSPNSDPLQTSLLVQDTQGKKQRHTRTWEALLEGLNQNKCVLPQQNAKKLLLEMKVTACTVGAIRHKKGRNHCFWGDRNKSRVIIPCDPLQSTTKRVGRRPKTPLQPSSQIHPYPHPI